MDKGKGSALFGFLLFSRALVHAGDAGYNANDNHGRTVLLGLMGNLKVYVDADTAWDGVSVDHRPQMFFGNAYSSPTPYAPAEYLTLDQVKHAVRLGLGNWQSVLPDLRIRMVKRRAEADCVIRFRKFGAHRPDHARPEYPPLAGNSTGQAFLPGAWKNPAGPLRPDLSCGERPMVDSSGRDLCWDDRTVSRLGACGARAGDTVFSVDPSLYTQRNAADRPCDPLDNNVILMHSQGAGFERLHFISSRDFQDYHASRTDAGKKWFRAVPVAGGTAGCHEGKGNTDPWDVDCLTDSDWRNQVKGYSLFGPAGAYDIVHLIQHEFGHTLLGGHSDDGADGCSPLAVWRTPGGSGYSGSLLLKNRRPVADANIIRRMRLNPANRFGDAARISFSTLFKGDGDSYWNARGVFDLDVDRLASGRSSWNAGARKCQADASGPWKGYARITYPQTPWLIVMAHKHTGEKRFLRDWRAAQALMAWPSDTTGSGHDTQWFQVDIVAPL